MSLDAATLQTLVTNGWVSLAQAVLTAVVALVALRVALNWTGSAMHRARIDTGTQILIKRGIAVGVVVLTSLSVLGTLGVNPAGLVAVAGAAGLAFSLAIQDILKNFFSGVYLLLERPFRVGDTIRVKEQQGVVENIGVRTTALRTTDNVQVLVPNAVVFAEVLTNHTHARPAPPAPDAESGRVQPTSDSGRAQPSTVDSGRAQPTVERPQQVTPRA